MVHNLATFHRKACVIQRRAFQYTNWNTTIIPASWNLGHTFVTKRILFLIEIASLSQDHTPTFYSLRTHIFFCNIRNFLLPWFLILCLIFIEWTTSGCWQFSLISVHTISNGIKVFYESLKLGSSSDELWHSFFFIKAHIPDANPQFCCFFYNFAQWKLFIFTKNR